MHLDFQAYHFHCSKRPTEAFFGDRLGLPLTMDPNFEDLSCEMKFGVAPPPFEEDPAFNEPCFAHVCSLADRNPNLPCPKIETSRWKSSKRLAKTKEEGG